MAFNKIKFATYRLCGRWNFALILCVLNAGAWGQTPGFTISHSVGSTNVSHCEGGTYDFTFTTFVSSTNVNVCVPPGAPATGWHQPRCCSEMPDDIEHIWYTSETGSQTADGVSTVDLRCNESDNWNTLYTTAKTVAGGEEYWVQQTINGQPRGERIKIAAPIVTPVNSLSFSISPTYTSNYCTGTTVTFTATGGSGYQWFKLRGEGEPPEQRGSGATFQTTESGTFLLMATDECGTPQQRISPPIQFRSTELGTVTLLEGPSVCQGTEFSNCTASADNAITFSWSVSGSGNRISASAPTTDPATGKRTTTSTITWHPDFSGRATVTVSVIGCGASSRDVSRPIMVHPKPETTLSPAEPLINCGDSCVAVTALPGFAYEWYYDHVLYQTGQRINICNAGSYSLRVRSAENCYSEFKDIPIRYGYAGDPSLLCDDALNWIETSAMDENGDTYSSSRNYFDNTGKPLQSQSKTYERPAIFATQTVYDRYDRAALSTLPAPTLQPDFRYKNLFITSESSAAYKVADFDSPSTIYNPRPVGDSSPGTVGWYYSHNNTIEDEVPVTDFPYSRTEFYEDGTGSAKRAASPGNFHRMGLGHEILTGDFPVNQELDDYLKKRKLTGLQDNLVEQTLKNEGVISVSRDQNGKYAISVADKTGKVLMSARKGHSTDYVLQQTTDVTSNLIDGSPDYRPVTYFFILHDQRITVNAQEGTQYIVESVMSNTVFSPRATENWPAGFYCIKLSEGSLNFSFTNYFLDVSYQFYDDAGRLRYSVSPNGYKQWLQPGTAFSDIDKTEYQYNFQGWLLKTIEPDAGMTEYSYRRDGKIRFSQNAKQREEGTFSYTNYDSLGRPVESGQYTLFSSNDFASLRDYLEVVKDNWMSWSGTKSDWVKTCYDHASVIPGLSNTPMRQTFVRGSVSRTGNENITTWYSYDEQGRVIWMAQKPVELPFTFIVEYTYDFSGNVLSVTSSSLNTSGSRSNMFCHYYEYDKDKRLKRAYTSNNGTDKKLRATYHYYLHGPLKRIELGNGIQGIDFVYNINGWLVQINHPETSKDPGHDGSGNGFRKDAFGMLLDYYESEISGLFPVAVNPTDINDPSHIHRLPVLEKQSMRHSWAATQPWMNTITQWRSVPTVNHKPTEN